MCRSLPAIPTARPRSAISCGCRRASPSRKSMMATTISRDFEAPYTRELGRQRCGSSTRAKWSRARDFTTRPSETVVLALVLRAVTGMTLSAISDATTVAADGRRSRRDLDQDQGRHSRSRPEISMRSCATMAGSACCWPMTARPGKADRAEGLPARCDRLAPATRGVHAERATPYFGYGYKFWLFPGEKRRFALLGVYGQSISSIPARSS